MRKVFISFVFAIGFFAASFAQTDPKIRDTKIADIIIQLPASSTVTFNRLMSELSGLGDVVSDLAPRLVDSEIGGDALIRYTISGLALYASKDANRKAPVAKSLCDAIPKAKSDEIRDFLFIQLQYVAGDESVKTAAQYLDNPRLADAAARVLIRIGNDDAGKALTSALENAAGVQQIVLIQALGDMRYQPAHHNISPLTVTGNPKLRKAALYSLAQIADPSSQKILAEAAEKAGYKYEQTDALGSYILFLNNSLPAHSAMVSKSAQKMLKATSENTQPAAKTAALELISILANDKAMSDVLIIGSTILPVEPVEKVMKYITNALKSSNKQYRQAALIFSTNVNSEKMYDELMKVAKKEKRAEVKAEIMAALSERDKRTEYSNINVPAIPRHESYQVSDAEKAEGFAPIFNGTDMTGWVGNLKDYIPRDGSIVCDPSQGGRGNLYTEKEYSDFIMRFEFLLTPAANNGIGIRTPLTGDAAYVGMELQVLDNEAPEYSNLKPYQYHGSVYGVIPAKRGFLKPAGEWNTQEIIAEGNHIKITLNGMIILDGDIAKASKNFTETIDGLNHSGLSNKSGHIGFLGHGSEVAFRNLRIKDLSKQTGEN